MSFSISDSVKIRYLSDFTCFTGFRQASTRLVCVYIYIWLRRPCIKRQRPVIGTRTIINSNNYQTNIMIALPVARVNTTLIIIRVGMCFFSDSVFFRNRCRGRIQEGKKVYVAPDAIITGASL